MAEIVQSEALLRLDGLIARSNLTTAFLEIMRIEEQITLARQQGADEIEGQPAAWAILRLNGQKNHYQKLCEKYNLPSQL